MFKNWGGNHDSPKESKEHLEPLWDRPYYIAAQHIPISPFSSQHPAQERGHNCNKQYHIVITLPGAAAATSMTVVDQIPCKRFLEA